MAHSNQFLKFDALESRIGERITISLAESNLLPTRFFTRCANYLNGQLPGSFPFIYAESMENATGNEFVSKKGKIAKRVAGYIRGLSKVYGVQEYKLSPEQISEIGNIAYQSMSMDENTHYIDFTRDFNWNDGQFGKEGSCYWGCYKNSRPTLESAGTFCLRYWNSADEEYTRYDSSIGSGRTWVFPYDDDNAALIAFNAYGPRLETSAEIITRLLSTEETPYTWHKLDSLYNSHDGDIPYINAPGIIIYAKGSKYSSVLDVNMNLYEVDFNGYTKEYHDHDEETQCWVCDDWIDNDSISYSEITEHYYCESCYSERFGYCEHCESDYMHDDLTTVQDHTYCDSCLSELFARCWNCEEYFSSDEITIDRDGDSFCEECADKHLTDCVICEEHIYNADIVTLDNGMTVCYDCKDRAQSELNEETHNGILYPRPVVTDNQLSFADVAFVMNFQETD